MSHIENALSGPLSNLNSKNPDTRKAAALDLRHKVRIPVSRDF